MQLFALTQCKIDKSAPKCWQYSINYDHNNKLLERNLNESQHVLILGSTIIASVHWANANQTTRSTRKIETKTKMHAMIAKDVETMRSDPLLSASNMKRWRRLRRRRRRRRSCCSKLNGSLLFFDLKRFSIENLCYIWYTTHDTRCRVARLAAAAAQIAACQKQKLGKKRVGCVNI